MAKRLKLNPRVCYFLGLHYYNSGKTIGIVTTMSEVVTRFVKTAIEEFEIEPNKILIEEEDDETKAYFYNSKLRKLLDNELEKRERIFKYKNEYSASYFAALFDMYGGRDPKGFFMVGLEERDGQILENLHFHTITRGRKTYFINDQTFATFIKDFSAKFS